MSDAQPRKRVRLAAYTQKWSDELGPVRILAIVEGWVMFRRPNAYPSIMRWLDFAAKFNPRERLP